MIESYFVWVSKPSLPPAQFPSACRNSPVSEILWRDSNVKCRQKPRTCLKQIQDHPKHSEGQSISQKFYHKTAAPPPAASPDRSSKPPSCSGTSLRRRHPRWTCRNLFRRALTLCNTAVATNRWKAKSSYIYIYYDIFILCVFRIIRVKSW